MQGRFFFCCVLFFSSSSVGLKLAGSILVTCKSECAVLFLYVESDCVSNGSLCKTGGRPSRLVHLHLRVHNVQETSAGHRGLQEGEVRGEEPRLRTRLERSGSCRPRGRVHTLLVRETEAAASKGGWGSGGRKYPKARG